MTASSLLVLVRMFPIKFMIEKKTSIVFTSLKFAPLM